jgi:hypothetical protein
MRVSEVHIEKPRPPRRAFRFQTPILAGSARIQISGGSGGGGAKKIKHTQIAHYPEDRRWPTTAIIRLAQWFIWITTPPPRWTRACWRR